MSKNHGSIRSYLIGFMLSLVLTFLAYSATVFHMNSGHTFLSHEIMIPLVMSLAVFQLFVQLVFFLHLGFDKSNQWNLGFFISTVSIILLVVLGSLWIMYHLNYNMMPQQVEEFIIHDEGFNHQ